MTGRPLIAALRMTDPKGRSLHAAAKRALRQALLSSAGDVGIAAAALSVSRGTLYTIPAARALIEKHGMGREGAAKIGSVSAAKR